MKHTPYTTPAGLQIGSRYQENGITAPIEDPDMIRIQEALLATPDYIRSTKIHNRYVAFYVFVCVFSVFYYLLFR